MPSFDIVSEVDKHELTNAIDQANREITTRFDFKGIDATFCLKENTISLEAPSDFQLKQMADILQNKLNKRNIDIRALDFKDPVIQLNIARQDIEVKQGLDKELAKKITKDIKNSKLKVQAAIQGEQVRATGKKRDDLQEVIAFLKENNYSQPLQFENFRD